MGGLEGEEQLEGRVRVGVRGGRRLLEERVVQLEELSVARTELAQSDGGGG